MGWRRAWAGVTSRADRPSAAGVGAPSGDLAKGRDQLQRAMTEGAGVVRTAASLATAGQTVESVAGMLGSAPGDPAQGELANLITAARAVLTAATQREETRGRPCPPRPSRPIRLVAATHRPPGCGANVGHGRVVGALGGHRRRSADGGMTPVARRDVVEAVGRSLAEDLGPLGDLTAALLPDGVTSCAAIVSRADGVLAGSDVRHRDVRAGRSPRGGVVVPRDGAALQPGAVVAMVGGPLASVLTAERTALNFLGHLSGVATLTRRYVDAVARANPSTRVLDTRKTTPGLRALEKAAVRAGGGHNHRSGLSDAVLIKDNHLAGMSITDAVARARSRWPGRMVEVECDRPEQVDEAVAAGATVVMLDNMSVAEVAECAARVHATGAGILVEVSGGVSLESAPALAAAGADLISVGALTHSAPVLDLGLDIEAGENNGFPVQPVGVDTHAREGSN